MAELWRALLLMFTIIANLPPTSPSVARVRELIGWKLDELPPGEAKSLFIRLLNKDVDSTIVELERECSCHQLYIVGWLD